LLYSQSLRVSRQDYHLSWGGIVKRLDFLDSLRGIAALFVLIHHVPLLVHPKLPIPDAITPFVMYGWTGVELFFVISAFSLCLTMPRHQASQGPLVSYAISRLSRIAPLFYLLVFCNVGYIWFIKGGVVDPLEVLTNLTFTFNLVPSHVNSMVRAGWTIGTEMLFYLIFPLLYVRFRTIGARIALICIAIGAWQLFKPVIPLVEDDVVRNHFAGRTLMVHIVSFALGMLAFSVYSTLKEHPASRQIGTALLACGVLGIGLLIQSPYRFGVLQANQWPSFFYALILVGLGLCPFSAIVNRVTTFYGKICYSTYLLHVPVLLVLEPAYRWIYAHGPGVPVNFAVCLVLTVAAVTGVAVVSYRYIEQPGLELGRAIKARLFAKGERASNVITGRTVHSSPGAKA
jgi:Predicted acyltransferases